MSAAQELTKEARRAVGGKGDTARGRGRGVGGRGVAKAPDPKQPYSVFPLLLFFSFFSEAAPRLSSKLASGYMACQFQRQWVWVCVRPDPTEVTTFGHRTSPSTQYCPLPAPSPTPLFSSHFPSVSSAPDP